MFKSTCLVRERPFSFTPAREAISFRSLSASSMFPLLPFNNLLPKYYRSHKDYMGRRPFDDDHPLPVVSNRMLEFSQTHEWTTWDKYVNPQIITASNLKPTEQYVGARSGRLFPSVGWRPVGSSWKFAKNWIQKRKGYAKGTWQERNIMALWKSVPRITALGPRARYEGKLTYSSLRLQKLLWAIDNGTLNPNETISLNTLLAAGVIGEFEVCWPGFCLCAGTVQSIPYPLKIEVQRVTPRALKLIEEAGGSVVCSYLSADGIYHEVRPEDYPVFPEQEMPDRLSFERVHGTQKLRGYLADWYESEEKYSHPSAGRRLSHYVVPPYDRDFPATFEEYERVKHHQKWHLGQPGTGTILPMHPTMATDHASPLAGSIQ